VSRVGKVPSHRPTHALRVLKEFRPGTRLSRCTLLDDMKPWLALVVFLCFNALDIGNSPPQPKSNLLAGMAGRRFMYCKAGIGHALPMLSRDACLSFSRGPQSNGQSASPPLAVSFNLEQKSFWRKPL